VTESNQPSRQILDDLPGRALKFLSTVSRSKPIHAALAERAYTADEHQEGWELVLQVSGYHLPRGAASDEDPEVSHAVVELDQWDEPNFRLIHAALARRHPDQDAFVFNNLEPATGAGAVISVSTLLDRLDALESGEERKATRKADHAALATLAKRKITKDERARLRGLVKVALKPAKIEPAAPPVASEADQQKALLKLWSWYSEWSETARIVITRRDHLIRLGLAKPKRPAKKGENEPV
jgi:hypothetical protein